MLPLCVTRKEENNSNDSQANPEDFNRRLRKQTGAESKNWCHYPTCKSITFPWRVAPIDRPCPDLLEIRQNLLFFPYGGTASGQICLTALIRSPRSRMHMQGGGEGGREEGTFLSSASAPLLRAIFRAQPNSSACLARKGRSPPEPAPPPLPVKVYSDA